MSTVALERAITIAGSQKALARAIGCQASHIYYWRRVSRRGVSADGAVAIEKATAGKVRREDLRPDLFHPTRKRSAT